MRILVAGGAGYIGSHMTRMLLEEGHEVVVLDSLATGFRDAVPPGALVKADVGHRVLVDTLFSNQRFDGVMHFASSIEVGESVVNPGKYYWNNVANTLSLLDAMLVEQDRRLQPDGPGGRTDSRRPRAISPASPGTKPKPGARRTR